MVQRSAHNIVIPKTGHPHMLHHRFATDFYRVTDIRLVQKTVGHVDLATPMIFSNMVHDEMWHAMRTFRQVEVRTKHCGAARPSLLALWGRSDITTSYPIW
jgi:site-specific recombinase XerC